MWRFKPSTISCGECIQDSQKATLDPSVYLAAMSPFFFYFSEHTFSLAVYLQATEVIGLRGLHSVAHCLTGSRSQLSSPLMATIGIGHILSISILHIAHEAEESSNTHWSEFSLPFRVRSTGYKGYFGIVYTFRCVSTFRWRPMHVICAAVGISRQCRTVERDGCCRSSQIGLI